MIPNVLSLLVDSSTRANLLSWLPEPSPVVDQTMEVDSTSAPAAPAPAPPKPSLTEPVPEGEIYLCLLIIHYLLTDPTTYSKAMDLVHQTVKKMQSLNRRSMDPIAAKIWFAVERSYELAGELADARP